MLEQANIRLTDPLEDQILEIMRDFENIAGIDEIFFELYRRFKIEHTRKFIANKLFKMVKNGSVVSVKGKKGIYQIKDSDKEEDTEEDIESLL